MTKLPLLPTTSLPRKQSKSNGKKVCEQRQLSRDMTEAELRQWVEANPGLLNEWDGTTQTPLFVAADKFQDVPLILWLVNEKGADVNAAVDCNGMTTLHLAKSLDVIKALLDCGTDPTMQEQTGERNPLTHFLGRDTTCNEDRVMCLLQNAQVRATVNNVSYRTALCLS